MKIAITVYADDPLSAAHIIEALKHVRGIELDGYTGKNDTANTFRVPKEAKAEPEEPAERPNVSPGLPAITKIGGAAKESIHAALENGMQPSATLAEHCKLLWSRGEVKFDGMVYYL